MKSDLPHQGSRLCDAQKYENAIWMLHPKGKTLVTSAELKSRKISQLYAEWSEANEGHSKELGKTKYQEIRNSVQG